MVAKCKNKRTYKDPDGFLDYWKTKINTNICHPEEATMERLIAVSTWEYRQLEINRLVDLHLSIASKYLDLSQELKEESDRLKDRLKEVESLYSNSCLEWTGDIHKRTKYFEKHKKIPTPRKLPLKNSFKLFYADFKAQQNQ